MVECQMCSSFNSRFGQLRPSIAEYKISKHLNRDVKNSVELISKILSCEHTCSSELHKFEKKIEDFSVFRAKIDGAHIVYAIDAKKILFFLRAFKNFSDYTKFLENDKGIKEIVHSLKA